MLISGLVDNYQYEEYSSTDNQFGNAIDCHPGGEKLGFVGEGDFNEGKWKRDQLDKEKELEDVDDLIVCFNDHSFLFY